MVKWGIFKIIIYRLDRTLQIACESVEQFCLCPCRSPLRKSVSFVCPNGIIRCLGRLLLYVILSSFFECSTSKISKAGLWICETIIPIPSLKSGVAEAIKEILETSVHSFQNILENLREYIFLEVCL